MAISIGWLISAAVFSIRATILYFHGFDSNPYPCCFLFAQTPPLAIAQRSCGEQLPGELDAYAEKRIREMGGVPSLKGYQGFPATLCTSINNEAVHGIPSPTRVIESGDVLKVDTCAYYQGFHGDSCIAIAVGEVSPEAAKLIRVTEEALYIGIEQVKAGNYLMDIAGAVQDHVEANGFSIIEDLTGHGVGRNIHEDPSVFFFRTRQMPNVKLRAGMTITIEPIVSAGSKHTELLADGWTIVTADHSLAAQFEHTVLVTQDGYEILSDRTKV